MTTLRAENVSKQYGSRRVIEDITVAISTSTILSITGSNGSGKSTLMLMLAGVLRPDKGTISLDTASATVEREELPFHVGLVSPAMNIYGEFTPTELLELQAKLRGQRLDKEYSASVLDRVGLSSRKSDPVRTFSSGLRQRVLIALAICPRPTVLLLDEPSITLDEAGREIVEKEIQLQAQTGIVVVATNDDRERGWSTDNIHLS